MRMLLVAVLVVVLAPACSSDEGMDVVIDVVAPAPGEPGDFTAMGSAVDDGVVCPSGVARWVGTFLAETGLPETEQPSDGDVVWVDFEFTCDDGTGMFITRNEDTVDNAAIEAARASGELADAGEFTVMSGTVDYDRLAGEGTRAFAFLANGGVRDVFTGEVTPG